MRYVGDLEWGGDVLPELRLAAPGRALLQWTSTSTAKTRLNIETFTFRYTTERSDTIFLRGLRYMPHTGHFKQVKFARSFDFCHFALLPYMQVGEIKKESLPDTRTPSRVILYSSIMFVRSDTYRPSKNWCMVSMKRGK